VKGRIKSSFLHLKGIAGHVVDPALDLQTVKGAVGKGLEDQEREGPVKGVRVDTAHGKSFPKELRLSCLGETPLRGKRLESGTHSAKVASRSRGGSPGVLNYGDCLSYGMAVALRQPLLFKGDDFSQTDVLVVEY
jgi:hypothetical protein